MNRNLLIAIAAFGLVSTATTVGALAAAHGQARATTALQASVNSRSQQTGGQSRTAPAFQQCMATRQGAGLHFPSTMDFPCAARSRRSTAIKSFSRA